MKRKNEPYKFRLQFFGAGDGDNGGGSDETNNQNPNDTKTGNDDGEKKDQSNTGEKTFTQSEVNQMMTREKKQGRQAVIKSLGFNTEEEAKDAMKLLNALLDSQKSDDEKNEEAKKNLEKDKSEAISRAEKAEAKLACIINGVDKDCVDDVLVIAMGKVSEDKPLEKVIEEMKKEKKYASFFGNSNNDSEDEEDNDSNNNNDNTGHAPGHSQNNDGKKMDYGAALAQKFTPSKSDGQKKTYF